VFHWLNTTEFTLSSTPAVYRLSGFDASNCCCLSLLQIVSVQQNSVVCICNNVVQLMYILWVLCMCVQRVWRCVVLGARLMPTGILLIKQSVLAFRITLGYPFTLLIIYVSKWLITYQHSILPYCFSNCLIKFITKTTNKQFFSKHTVSTGIPYNSTVSCCCLFNCVLQMHVKSHYQCSIPYCLSYVLYFRIFL